ncbi:hypothetical protein [Geodermatophilus sp. DF01-2]|uniref:hypothetical protein n=1 Tax=Geodermatophilus sp. DF01-2 TaxID=2559610 RepID=UPI001432212B|nr:hypothetical protein [Geodermatophilus sp. DF01_2]
MQSDDDQRADDESDHVVPAEGLDREGLDRLRDEGDDRVAHGHGRPGLRAEPAR